MADPILITSFGLGLAYASAPGGVNAESIRRGLAGGFRQAFLVQSGSLLGDMGWAILALAGLSLFLQDGRLRALLGGAGALLLLWFALGALRTAHRPHPSGEAPTHTGASAFGTGIVLSVANPFGPIFWLGVGGGLAAGGLADQSVGGAAAFIAAFGLGALAWSLGIASLLAYGRRWAGPTVFRIVDLACGLAFGYFGVSLLVESIRILAG